MFKSLVKVFLLLNAVFGVFAVNIPMTGDSSVDADCRYHDKAAELDIDTLLCRGARALRNILMNLSKSNDTIVIVRGLEIVPTKDTKSQRSNVSTPHDHLHGSSSVLERFSDYLRTHELNIKFSDLLAEESARFAASDLERNSINAQEPRKKDKEQNTLMMAAMMFAKVLLVMGLSGIAAIALKALGVAMTALMMAGMVGLKSLSHQGHESSSVQYVTADSGHHHRRRRRRSVDRKLLLSSSTWQKMMKIKNNAG